jgi:pimeloyl-ACP methyl ester carboxylesterase
MGTVVLIIGIVLALFWLSVLVGAGYQVIAASRDLRIYPPLGRLVDVGGYRLHLTTAGAGKPTVVMDAGLGHFSLIWSLVQKEVATFTHVCTYDRAGYAWSDRGPQPRTSSQIVRELHTLLANGGIMGPYILVGHSFGGLNMYLYACQYPDEVAGLILVDAVSKNILAHDGQGMHYFIGFNKIKYRLLTSMTRFGLFRLFLRLRGPERALGFITSFPPETRSRLVAGILRKSYQASAAENASLRESITQAEQAHFPTKTPLVVLSHGIPDMFSSRMSAEESALAEKTWQAIQEELASLSTDGRLIVAEKGGHKIHIDQPEVVVEAIRQLVEEIRSRNLMQR